MNPMPQMGQPGMPPQMGPGPSGPPPGSQISPVGSPEVGMPMGAAVRSGVPQMGPNGGQMAPIPSPFNAPQLELGPSRVSPQRGRLGRVDRDR